MDNDHYHENYLDGVFLLGAACPRAAPADPYEGSWVEWEQFNKIDMEYENIFAYGGDISETLEYWDDNAFRNYWSKNDSVLKNTYPTGELLIPMETPTLALGRYGRREADWASYPDLYTDVEVSDTINSHYDYPKDVAEPVWEDIQEQKDRLE